MSKQSHIERTAHEPRDPSLHTLAISDITPVTPTIRLYRLALLSDTSLTFLPGQWVDLHPPPSANVPKPGGFTITSAPSLAQRGSPTNPDRDPYIELAIQASPENPAAAYLFLPVDQLLGTSVQVRIGGSFVFPPPHLVENQAALRKVVFVAGGMGINPLMSMLSYIGEQGDGARYEVRVLYSVKDPRTLNAGGEDGAVATQGKGILFFERIAGLFKSGRARGGFKLFLTGGPPSTGTEERGQDHVVACNGLEVPVLRRRITVSDVEEALGDDKDAAVVYVCGVPTMTDEFVEALVSPEGTGMDQSKVLFEKWW